jgi:hypothetical protein
MASLSDIAAGVKIRLLADLDFFSEGTEGTVKEVRAHDERIWHAIVTWSDKGRGEDSRRAEAERLRLHRDHSSKDEVPADKLPIPFPD